MTERNNSMFAVAAMVKTPGYSSYKTRLARTSSPQKAESVYAALLRHQEAEFKKLALHTAITPYWAVAEAEALKDERWQALPCIYQGEGDLGQRLARIEQELMARHQAFAVMSSDCPQFAYRSFEDILPHLRTAQPTAIIAPSSDGGFNMFATNQALGKVWLDVEYSQPDTREQLEAHLSGFQIHYLPTLTDIDTHDHCQSVLDESTASGTTLPPWLIQVLVATP